MNLGLGGRFLYRNSGMNKMTQLKGLDNGTFVQIALFTL